MSLSYFTDLVTAWPLWFPTDFYLSHIFDHNAQFQQNLISLPFISHFYGLFTDYSIFSSFLQHGIIFWGLTYDIYTKQIFALQKKAIRAISFKSFASPSSQILPDIEILRLYGLFDLKLLTVVYESRSKLLPSMFHNVFKPLSDIVCQAPI